VCLADDVTLGGIEADREVGILFAEEMRSVGATERRDIAAEGIGFLRARRNLVHRKALAIAVADAADDRNADV